MMKIRGIFFILAIVSAGMLTNCKDELTVYLDTPVNKPLVYCLLNPADTIQYLRVQRFYLGGADANESALQSDSIYYQDVKAQLERIDHGTVKQTIPFYPTTTILKDTGLFTTKGHVIYELKEPIFSGSTYRLSVNIGGIPDVAVSSVTPQTGMQVVGWNGWPGKSINMTNENFDRVTWKKATGINSYEMSYLFRYYELSDHDTIARQIIWKVPDKIYSAVSAGEEITYEVPISQWFLFLADHISDNPAVTRRIAGKFDILWEFKGAALEDYLARTQMLNGEMWLDYALYSNVENAVGIFSFQSTHVEERIDISMYTLERLTTHPLTKDLKFDGRVSW